MNQIIKEYIQRQVDKHIDLSIAYPKDELILDSYYIADKLMTTQRQVRAVLSELRKDMSVITYSRRITGRKGLYVLYDETNQTHQREFARVIECRLKEFKSLYFNNIVKYLPILKEDKMIHKLNMITLALQGETE